MHEWHETHMKKLTSDQPASQSRPRLRRRAIPRALWDSVQALGPTPKTALMVFVDLGLSDCEIARYFAISQTCVSELRRIWRIGLEA
jgi:hypothetical protein